MDFRGERIAVMKKRLCLLSVVGLSLVGCAGVPTSIPDANTPAGALFTEKCGACHAVPHPKRNTATEWQHLLTLMERRMAERSMVALSTTDREILLGYLHRHAR